MSIINKLLTITIPAYNAERYLYRCLYSVAACRQYLDKIEILVVNDGSADCTPKIAAQFVEEYPGSFYLINKENGGHGSAINRGIREAHGQYFIVLDADDWLDPNALGELIRTIENMLHEEIDLISYHYNRVDMETGDSVPVRQERVDYRRIYSFEELPVTDIYFALACICYRTSLLKSMKLMLQEHTFYVDVEYMLLPLPRVQTVYFLDLFLYRYFVGNTEQSIYLPTMVKRYAHHNRVMHRVIDELFSKKSEEGVKDGSCLYGNKKEYALRILEKLLYTHYAVSLIYDPDHAQGVRRAKEFDAYLKNVSFSLYRRTKASIPFLRIYRKFDFDISRIRKAYGYKIYLRRLDQSKAMCARVRRLWDYLKYINK